MKKSKTVALAIVSITAALGGAAVVHGGDTVPSTPVAERPVVDLRTWPMPSTDLSKLPNTQQNKLIKYGQKVFDHTSEYIGPEVPNPAMRYAGNNLSCSSCHGDSGTKPYAAPLVGTYGAYPQYIARFGKQVTLEDRINLCMTRSMAGKPLPDDLKEMKGLVAYIEYLSRGIPKSAKLIGEKSMPVEEPKREANVARGEVVYKDQCAVCHGDNGQGKRVGRAGDHKGYTFPPVWGPDSTSEGASMFRLLEAYHYIYTNMPFGQATSEHPALSKDDAYDVAAFIVSHPRQPRVGEVAKDFANPYDKPADFPWGPYVDSFTEAQHKYGPFDPIRAEDKAAREKLKKEKAAQASPTASN